MPHVTTVITVGSTDVPVETIRTLQTELAAVGLPVVGAEADGTPRFGADTQARVREFQKLYGLPETDHVDAGAGGVMTIAALVATESDRSQLREKLKSALNEVPDSPEYNYWLARYAILAGDYATAHTAARLAHDFGNIGIDVWPIIEPGLQPEVPFPENFYTYRDDLVPQDQLNRLCSQLASLTKEEYTAYLAKAGINVDQGYLTTVFDLFVNQARSALKAINAWQAGNHHAVNGDLSQAIQNYQDCQSLAVGYFVDRFGYVFTQSQTGLERLRLILKSRESDQATYGNFWSALRWRRILLSLQELERYDRQRVIGTDGAFESAAGFVTTLVYSIMDDINRVPFPTQAAVVNQAQRLDYLLIIMSTIWVPLATFELYCQMRQFDAAINGLADFVTSQTSGDVQFRYLCEFIEIPFARLLSVEALLERADAEYKAGTTVDQTAFPDAPTYQNLLAAQTYEKILSRLDEDGHQYAAYVKQGRDSFAAAIQHSLMQKDTTSLVFRSLGKQVSAPISAATSALPGLDRTLGPHQSIVKVASPDNRDNNPRLYAIGLLATAKLEQIKAGFNYLGYPSDYVPPWRFSFLLDRARYFAEHAKNAQRDYMNFLNNAEHEEFQEQSAAQSVEMEQSNVKLETARVDQAQAEVAASQASVALATQTAQDAKDRYDAYYSFDQTMTERENLSSVLDSLESLVKFGVDASMGNEAGAAGDVLKMFSRLQKPESQMRRDFELGNFKHAMVEANLASTVAQKKLAVDQAGLLVAGLQRQAALLRHEFAIQNLNYLRGRTMNLEQWFRLANSMRSISETYLRKAIAIAFLAQQAYEFEVDKAINVIRFDYDLSSVGAMLAADFLIRDLDSLEEDLVLSQRSRQQQVRFALSMAREFPETLRALGETGEVLFSVRLEQLERRFPGLFNLRLSGIDVQAIALMDPNRFSVELTHLGTGMIRLKAQPGTSPLNSTDLAPNGDWLSTAETDWPVKVHVSGPQTAVFSGPSSQEAASLGMIAANERRAFEGLPGASSWRIDMSMKENQVVQGTLADVLITFTLTGFYDAGLKQTVRDAVASAKRSFATTSLISARRALPDAYYSLVHYGKLDWDVSERTLTLNGTPNELRNLAVILALAPDGPELGRCYCHYSAEVQIASGTVKVLTALPQLTMTPNGLVLNCAYTGTANASWDFGDGTPIEPGTSVAHPYARPGRYEVTTRLVEDGRLFEYRSAVVVSANHPVAAPLAIVPVFSASPVGTDGMVMVTVSPPSGTTDVGLDCSTGAVRATSDSGPVSLQLTPGTYAFDFKATRKLPARFYGKQRYLPDAPITLNRGRTATNRTFDATTGAETTTSLNAFGTQLFRDGNAAVTLSPVDRWTLELPLADNPWFTTVSPSDAAEFDARELADAILSLEFVGPQ